MKFFKRKKVTETKKVLDETRCDFCFQKIKENRVGLVVRAEYGSQFDTFNNDINLEFCDSCFEKYLGWVYRQKERFDMYLPNNFKETTKLFAKLCEKENE